MMILRYTRVSLHVCGLRHIWPVIHLFCSSVMPFRDGHAMVSLHSCMIFWPTKPDAPVTRIMVFSSFTNPYGVYAHCTGACAFSSSQSTL